MCVFDDEALSPMDWLDSQRIIHGLFCHKADRRSQRVRSDRRCMSAIAHSPKLKRGMMLFMQRQPHGDTSHLPRSITPEAVQILPSKVIMPHCLAFQPTGLWYCQELRCL